MRAKPESPIDIIPGRLAPPGGGNTEQRLGADFTFCSGEFRIDVSTILDECGASFLWMDTKEDLRTCSQCCKEVAKANFALHETHCSRFLCVCPDCDEAVPRQQLEQHREEQHSQVRCSKCNQKMERCRLVDHEAEECVERLQSCQFCTLELRWKELDEHRLACGSRTELCSDCGRYVTLRDQQQHGLTCGSGPPPQTASKLPPSNSTAKMPVSCTRCKVSFPAEEIRQHELECFSAAGWFDAEEAEPEEEERQYGRNPFTIGAISRLSSTYKSSSRSNGAGSEPWGDPDQISTCPHCHLALPLLTLRWHKGKCQIHTLLK